MPSTTPPVDSKSRQSSGGRSFFGRKTHKERTPDYQDDGGSVLQLPSASSSTNGSRSSSYSHKNQNHLLEVGNEDTTGLSMTAGVITSIPYDSVAADGRTPISVDYLPKNDKMPARKEPLPHHLSKGGQDYHQYPAWDPQDAPKDGPPQLSGPRPPPHYKPLSSILTSRDRSTKTLQHPGIGDATTYTNGNHCTINSVCTGDTS